MTDASPIPAHLLNVIVGVTSNMGQGNINLPGYRRTCVPFRLRWARRLFAIVFALLFLSLFMAGCGGGGNSNGNESFIPIPDGTDPCKHPEYWPRTISSTKHPFLIHFRNKSEFETAKAIVGYLDAAWDIEIDQLGFTEPPPDQGLCGPDGSFDVFVWRGHRSCQVEVVSEQILTPWGGRASYMILDPWGPYGGADLPQTVGHEFVHATQAADDWHEIGISFEMSAVYIEQLFGPIDKQYIAAFQSWPEWSLLWDDGYVTWYMYGSALYLHFLRDKYFDGDDRFLPALWRAVRNTPDPLVNVPNLVDGFNTILAPFNTSFMESVPLFARWRYYTGYRDDGKHFRHWPLTWVQMPFQPEATLTIPTIILADADFVFNGPMVLGSVYMEVERAQEGQDSFRLILPAPPDPSMRWVVQALPGIVPGSDGDFVNPGPARVAFDPDGKRTLVFTLLPVSGFNPNSQSGERYPLTVKFSP